ncbi:MAG TPA: TlpA disulfide reductase family protein [Kofleriaceae bacterium]|jgi:thiol-disulfide isomerase/thioredoxin
MRWHLVLAIALVACKRTPAEPPPLPRDSELAWQRVVLTGADKTEVAFLTGLPRGSDDRAIVVTGTERVVGQVRHVGASLRVEFPIYLTALVLDPGPDHGYQGRYEIASPAFGTGSMPLRASPVAGPTLSALATVADGPWLDLHEARTVWQLMLGGLRVKLVLQQRGPGELDGTVFFDNGHVTYLGGTGRGDHAVLGGFEGTSPSSLDLVFDAARGTVTGTWRAGQLLSWKEAVTGTRTADFELQPKITLDGDRPVLRHPQLRDFDGKPLIVELAATWCETCKLMVPVLRDIYGEHKGEGLAMVSLLYELTNDPNANREGERRFRELDNVPWPVRAVPGEQEDLGDIMPEGLNNVDVGGFPVVIFRRRDGTIAGVQSGFPAASTGAAHDTVIARMRSLTSEILRSP